MCRDREMEVPAPTPIDQFLTRIDELIVADRKPPLTAEERSFLRGLLSQIPEYVNTVTRVRGREASWRKLINPSVDLQRYIYNRRAGRPEAHFGNSQTEGFLGTPDASFPDLPSYVYRASIMAEIRMLRYDLREPLQSEFQSLLYDMLTQPFSTATRFQSQEDWRELWREQWARSLDIRTRPQSAAVVTIRVGDRLYGHGRPGDPTSADLDRFRLDWRAYIPSVYTPGANLGTEVEGVIERLKTELVQHQHALAAPESQAAREAIDRLYRTQNQLSPQCDMWTYPELEYWIRTAWPRATSRAIYDWLRRHAAALNIDFVLDRAPEEVDVTSFAELVAEAIPLASKRVLCDLLTAMGAPPPPVWGRESFVWYRVELKPGYLPPQLLPQLASEATTPSTVAIDVDQQQSRRYLTSDPSRLLTAVGTQLLNYGLFSANYVQIDLIRIADEAVVLESDAALVVLGVEGRTVVSPIPLPDATVPPMRVLVEPGDVLIVSLLYRSSILRSNEGPSAVVVLRFSLRI